MAGLLIKMIAAEKKIKAGCIDGTTIVDEAARRHLLSPVATAALGRTMMGALLVAANFKKKEHNLTIRILGDGPLGRIIVTANGNFQVRGYVQEPGLELPLTEEGKLDVGRAVGKNGHLHVTKDLLLTAPYTGTCKLVSGEIGEDFANYLYFSEQTPAAIALGVLVNPDGTVLKAGGYLVQLLPDAGEDLVKKLEENITKTLPISTLMQQDISVGAILAEYILSGFNPVKVDEQETEFFCECSKEKLEKTLISLGEKELSEIISEQGCGEITCHFCNQKYLFPREELQSLLAEAKG